MTTFGEPVRSFKFYLPLLTNGVPPFPQIRLDDRSPTFFPSQCSETLVLSRPAPCNCLTASNLQVIGPSSHRPCPGSSLRKER